jgi:colanic acid biosynthesis glycosyl transferase WcaI
MFWVQDLWPESLSATGAVRSQHILRWVGKLVRFIYRRCDRVLVQSEGFIAPVLARGAATDSVLYFPNNAEALYKPVTLSDDAPERAGMPAGFRVMFAGNIGEAQDLGSILGAAEKLKAYPDIHWVILGDGRMLAWVKKEIIQRSLHSTFHLLGKHPVESMPSYFSLADALLVTLKKDPVFSLTIPSKLQSYLACGKPIIAALEGEGARIVRESGAGLIATPENPDALAKAVLELYGMNVSVRKVMGERGLDFFNKNFERDMLLSRLDGWLRELIQGEVK